MTETLSAGVRIEPAPHRALRLIEVWGDVSVVQARLSVTLPLPGKALAARGWRALWWEPRTWLIRSEAAQIPALAAILGAALNGEGALTDVSGAYRRIALVGSAWRSLLMIGGVFDAESPSFGPGCVAGTLIHNTPVRLDVLSPTRVETYVAPSYAENLLHHWRRSPMRLAAAL